MPLEIRELHIKVATRSDENRGTTASAGGAQVDQEAVVAVCVEQVLEILKEKSER